MNRGRSGVELILFLVVCGLGVGAGGFVLDVGPGSSAHVVAAADGDGDRPPETTLNEVDADDSDSSADDPERLVPSEQVPFGVRTTYGRADLERPSGGAGVTVAVLDTGVDRRHPDLRDRVTLCRNFTGETVTETCTDENGHGTHVAGTVAADAGDDGAGIYGVAPEAKLYAFKTCDKDGRCSTQALATGIRAATDEGADVILMSLGGRPEPSVEAATRYAASSGVVVVAAAGNAGPDPGSILYPAAHPYVVGVGAVGPRSGQRVHADNYRVPDFSGRGLDGEFREDPEYLEVAGPGVSVLSPLPGGGYAHKTGTSMAAPHVAGLAAKLLASPNPPATAAHLRAELRVRAPRFDVVHGLHARAGYDSASGFGMPTVVSPQPQFAVAPPVPVDDEPFVLDAGATRADSAVTYRWDTTADGTIDREGERIKLQTHAGVNTARLEVTDADGARADVSRPIFVNGRPRVTVSVPAVVRTGEDTTLTATVADEFGETSVTWRFSDGSTATGETAHYAFQTVESTIEVTVEDEFGASSTERVTVRTSDGGDGAADVWQFAPFALVGVMLFVATLAYVIGGRGGR